MLFNSFHFLLFFPVVVILYFIIAQKYRWIFLLLASYYFYMSWNPAYIVLIIASTLVDYFTGLKMGKLGTKSARRPYLIISLLSNLGLLFVFKYYNFFGESTNTLLQAFSFESIFPKSRWLLPVGISFYTFQTLSYSIDIYFGKIKPEKHLGIFAVFVSFFPQLVAGPIERASHLLPQFRKKFVARYDDIRSGLLLMAWGLFKKVVIADRISQFVEPVYHNPNNFTGIKNLIATYFFAFQIYCDFSGYSDMAIGLGRILGFDIMTNFRRPYFARNIQEFWARWHISLSTWFRDYLYIPLGGNRVKRYRYFINIMIVFLVSGIWHGANHTFIVWGFLHGVYIVGWQITRPLRLKFLELTRLSKFPRVTGFFEILLTFHLAVIAWVFFRADYMTYALVTLKKIAAIRFTEISQFIGAWVSSGQINFLDLSTNSALRYEFFVGICMVIVMEGIHFIVEKKKWVATDIGKLTPSIRWPAYVGIIVLIILFGEFTSKAQFIYFQF